MASSESGDKVYQFISDFSHKENLSGRVRAACITCRRKKIKCSGDSPCTTCREKGLVCEGLTPRKRPKRNPSRDAAAADRVSELAHAAPRPSGLSRAHSRAGSTSSNKPVRPTVDLLKLSRGNSDDSGYASWRTDPPSSETPSFHEESQFQQSPFVSNDSTPVSPEFSNWTFPGYGTKDTASQSATHLDAAAEVLEGQAMSLRQLATQRRSQAVEAARRQNVALSLQTDNLFSSSCPQAYQQNAIDDLSMFVGPRSAAAGFAPSAGGYTSGWDTCPASPTSYGFQQTDMAQFAIDYTAATPTQERMVFGENASSGTFDTITGDNPNTRQRSLPDSFFPNNNWAGFDQG